MPLSQGKSRKTFVKNLKTELEHGKPMKQSLAIAYAMKRKAKKMADGGPITMDPDKAKQLSDAFKGATHYAKGGDVLVRQSNEFGTYAAANAFHDAKHGDRYPQESREGVAERNKQFMKKGHERTLEAIRSSPSPKLKGLAEGGEVDDIVDRVIQKMSEGGQVANDTLENIDDTPAQYDDLVLRDDLESHDTGENSDDELGNEQEDEDRKDIVSRVMASRRKKDRMPNPA